MRSSGGRLIPSSRSSTNARNCGPSSGGKPSMSAMTRIGMCCAYSAAASTASRPSNVSMSSWQNARVAGSCRLIAVLVNAPSSSLRACWWNGGGGGNGGRAPDGGGARGGGGSAADRGDVAGGAEVAHDDRPRGEPLGVVGDRRHVLVPGRQPPPAEPVGVRDRAALPQIVLDRIGVGGPLRLQVGEVGRPIVDRPGDDLAAGALEFLVRVRR